MPYLTQDSRKRRLGLWSMIRENILDGHRHDQYNCPIRRDLFAQGGPLHEQSFECVGRELNVICVLRCDLFLLVRHPHVYVNNVSGFCLLFVLCRYVSRVLCRWEEAVSLRCWVDMDVSADLFVFDDMSVVERDSVLKTQKCWGTRRSWKATERSD